MNVGPHSDFPTPSGPDALSPQHVADAHVTNPIDLALLARCEATRLVSGCVSCARVHEYIAGGVMVRDVPGTWCNIAIGVALDQPFAPGELERIEDFYISAGIEPRIETSPYIHRGALAQLAARGWVVRGYDSLLYRPLQNVNLPAIPQIPGLTIHAVTPDDHHAMMNFARVSCSGFTPPGKSPTSEDIELCLRTANSAAVFPLMACIDGEPASAGFVEVRPSGAYAIAALYALSTLPQFRKRGLQQALIAARLTFARDRGADVALIAGPPGAGTERNVRRVGFEIAYTITFFTLPCEGRVALP
jgi:hypothetical protein